MPEAHNPVMSVRLFLRPVEVPALGDPLAVLRTVARRGDEYALLHSAHTGGEAGTSLLGFDPLVTVNVDSTGVAAIEGLEITRVAGMPPLEALQMAVMVAGW